MEIGKGESTYFNNWYRVGLFNLLLVSSIGLLLRFKMAASLPGVNHKYFLHGHSHFAFSGWISLVLMTAIIQRIHNNGTATPLKPVFKYILWAQLLTAYGMLFSFPVMGYAPISIAFSTLSILVSYAFVWTVWKDCNARVWGSSTASNSIKAAMAFMVISSFSAFWLATLMGTHSPSQFYYFTALYFFLHFQYNGWFFFGIVGLWLTMLPKGATEASGGLNKGVKWMIASCIPAAALSCLWMKVPAWVYLISVIAALIQFGAIVVAWNPVKKLIPAWAPGLSKTQKVLLSIAAFSFLLRIVLQAFSTIPMLTKFGFAYRPVVIGYLHLILLGCISMFLFSYLMGKNLWQKRQSMANLAIGVFLVGLFLNELTLMGQGLGYIGWINIPYTNEVLLGAAAFLFTGLLLLNVSAQNGPQKID